MALEIEVRREEIDPQEETERVPQPAGIEWRGTDQDEILRRTLLDERFRIQGRTTFYEGIIRMQNDLDGFLHKYNHERPLQGRGMNGRNPVQAFLHGQTPTLRQAPIRNLCRLPNRTRPNDVDSRANTVAVEPEPEVRAVIHAGNGLIIGNKGTIHSWSAHNVALSSYRGKSNSLALK